MRRKRTPDQHRERLRRFARKVVNIDDAVFLATEMQRAREGKMSPQEKAKYFDLAYHFDVDQKPAPPQRTIRITHGFADGEKLLKVATVITEGQE